VFLENLEKDGFKILKKKFTQNAFYSKISKNKIEIKFEVLFKEIKNYITKEYETVEGTRFVINTLSPESLILEKISAYLKRGFIRDIYDIYFLLRYSSKEKIKNALLKLLKNFKKQLMKRN